MVSKYAHKLKERWARIDLRAQGIGIGGHLSHTRLSSLKQPVFLSLKKYSGRELIKMGLGKRTQGSHSESRDTNTIVEYSTKMRTHIVLTVVVASLMLQTVTKGQESRISQGQIPPPGKYPSIARLISSKFGNATLCVLSIINRDWLVGPGACFATVDGVVPKEFLTVIVGDEIINETEPYEQELKVERYIVHHRIQNKKILSNSHRGDDIAVVKVTPQIRFNNRVTAANLPTCKDFQTGIVGMIAGYGTRLDNTVTKPNHRLTEISSKIIPLDECSRIINGPLDDRLFCVESINSMSTCFGDQGAPFYEVKSDHHMVLLGFLSNWPRGLSGQGQDCGRNANISTFTRLPSYVGWIHRRVSGCGNHPWWNDTEYHPPANGR